MIDFREINFYLLKNNPYYYGLLQEAKILFNDKFPSYAGVAIKNNVELTINPVKFKTLCISDQAGMIVHEFEHVFSGHIKQSVQKKPQSVSASFNVQHNAMLANVAMDAEINSRIYEIKNSKVLGENAPEETRGVFAKNFNLKEGDSWQVNFKELIHKAEKVESDVDHSYFTESDQDPEYMDHVVGTAAKKAKEAMRGLLAGNMPKSVQDFLVDYESNKNLPWYLLLRQFMQSLVSVDQRSTWKKKNRRFPGKLPGYKKIPKVKLLVGIDASGSVGDDEYGKFLNEIHAIWMTGVVELWIAEFDYEIHAYYKYDGNRPKRKAYGGTNFIPVHEKALAENFKGVIMLTDGQAYFPPKEQITYRSLWCMSTEEKAPYGQTVRIK